MRSIISGFCVAFSLYSAIPVPQVAWEKKTMRWALSFLPLIGVIIGAAEWLWFWFCTKVGAANLLYSIIASLIPLIISGGIHLDGLTDACDALCSFGEREKKLEILKDPHVGAFGPMWLIAFFMAQAALFSQIYTTPGLLPVALAGFAIARAVGGRKIVTMPCAKDSGLAFLFAEGSDKKVVSVTLTVETLAFAALFAAWLIEWNGLPIGVIAYPLLLAAWDTAHRRLSVKVFGGITGDLAGFFISTAELLALAVAALGGLLQ